MNQILLLLSPLVLFASGAMADGEAVHYGYTKSHKLVRVTGNESPAAGIEPAPVHRASSSQFLSLTVPSTEREKPTVTHVERVLSELKNEQGETEGYEIPGDKTVQIFMAKDFKGDGKFAKLHPRFIPPDQIGDFVANAKNTLVDTTWGTLDSCMHEDVSGETDKKAVADLVSAAQKRADYKKTLLGQKYARDFYEVVDHSPKNQILNAVLDNDPSVKTPGIVTPKDIQRSVRDAAEEATSSH